MLVAAPPPARIVANVSHLGHVLVMKGPPRRTALAARFRGGLTMTGQRLADLGIVVRLATAAGHEGSPIQRAQTKSPRAGQRTKLRKEIVKRASRSEVPRPPPRGGAVGRRLGGCRTSHHGAQLMDHMHQHCGLLLVRSAVYREVGVGCRRRRAFDRGGATRHTCARQTE
jgi:hypothetical protein